MRAEVFILCPAGDPIATFYSRSYTVVEGSLDNVLSRYVKAQQMRGFDYVVRVTGDCPFLSSFVITNHIFKAINHGYDYVSNVDPEVRTELDGRDVEVLSSLALEWLDEHATTDEDKEHVTTLIRKVRPKVLRRAHLLSRIDISDMKLSIDTPEDFKNSERRINSFFEKRKRAEEDVGIDNVFYC
jgi:spore coat polysaccharide biosynthesis protein SpsF (cytidylyltransferase family)